MASIQPWIDILDGRRYSLIGLVELNWAAIDGPRRIYDKAVDRQQKPLFCLSVEQLAEMLSALAGKGKMLETLYFTGDDPAGHRQLGQLIELAHQFGIPQVGLQCDGARIAHDDQLLDTLVRLKPLLFVEFDGFDETASLILHGRRDLPFEARRGLDRLTSAGLPAVLLVNVAQGINLQEVGAIARFGLAHPAVCCAIFRPLPLPRNRFGTSTSLDVTAAAIMAALEQQSDGLFRQDAFTPMPCCQPEHHFYALIPYAVRPGSLLDHAPGPEITTNGQLATPEAAPCFLLSVHDCMTPWNSDLPQAQFCPLMIVTSDGRTIPYYLYNGVIER